MSIEKPLDDFNKNERQFNFNQVKGTITELNDGEKFCSITLKVGHENPRVVNFAIKKNEFDALVNKFAINDKVCVKFYLKSRLAENGRYYTTAAVLNMCKEKD